MTRSPKWHLLLVDGYAQSDTELTQLISPPDLSSLYSASTEAAKVTKASSTLTCSDHYHVTTYLQELDGPKLIKIGLSLGLYYPTLKKLNPELILHDMVYAWLRKDDGVTKATGEPSWKSLSEALNDCGHQGLASMIREKGTHIITAWYYVHCTQCSLAEMKK